jgi:hypothetical protein
MKHGSDDDGWINEAPMLTLVELPRSTFLGWTKEPGFVEADLGAAYGLDEVLEMALLTKVRKYLGDDTISAWKHLRRKGTAAEMVGAARALEAEDRFDLVLEPEHGGICMVRSDKELIAAVKVAGAPRPVIVLDVADWLRLVKAGFERKRSTAARPLERRAGRPRRKAEVRFLPGGAS